MTGVGIDRIEPTDVLGGIVFVVGLTLVYGVGGVPPKIEMGVALLLLGVAAVFGKRAFLIVFRGLATVSDSDDPETK